MAKRKGIKGQTTIFLKCVKREIAQLKKIVLCLFPEICVKGDSLIRENSIMLISNYFLLLSCFPSHTFQEINIMLILFSLI
jgi:hypothetical protein